jgi:pyruvate kinase
VDHPPSGSDETRVMAQALRAIDRSFPLRCIAAFTTSGYTARLVSAERPGAPIAAVTPRRSVYQSLGLLWGVRPLLAEHNAASVDELLALTESVLRENQMVAAGDKILVVAGVPTGRPGGTNFLKLHTIGG